jgi:signal peptidase I
VSPGAGRQPAAAILRSVTRAGAQFLLTMVAWLAAVTVLPLALGWHAWLVMSDSMQPRLKPGDIVLGAPAGLLQVQPGNVVLFAGQGTAGHLTIHRVVRRTADGGLVTRGDANQSDDPTPVRDVYGLGRLRVPMIGLPAYWQRHGEWPKSAAAVAAVLALLLLAGQRGRSVRAGPKHRAVRSRGVQRRRR